MTDHQREPHLRPENAPPREALPRTRRELLELHRAARARRDAAPLGSQEYREAVLEVGEIEVEISAVETGVPASRR